MWFISFAVSHNEKALEKLGIHQISRKVAQYGGKAKEEKVIEAAYITEHHKQVINYPLLHDYSVREKYP